ncbi:MOSC domain-containing protein [Novispirillum sp. DQ9]|uniref:MOSC domain-containing protein n=1 Tax=Novispirillum sp. DQ9 TaxID=3398612 RepID=UPI003C7CEB26
MTTTMTIAALYRYPVKGLSPEPLDRCVLEPGAALPGDRRFALLAGSAPFDALRPTWQPRTAFVTLRSHPRVGDLTTRWISVANTLTVERNGKQVARGDLTTAIGRAMLEEFFGAYLKEDGPTPRIVEAQGFSFSDTREQVVSIITRASLAELERVGGKPVDERRLRANIVLDGTEAWAEDTWHGRRLRLGAAVVEVITPPAPLHSSEATPDTGIADSTLARLLKGGLGRSGFGVHARVVAGGAVAVGDQGCMAA